MITVSVKLKDDDYMPKVDTAFVELANMKKISEGEYKSNEDVLGKCFVSAKALMKRDWFRENVVYMKWKVGDKPQSDLVPLFNKELRIMGRL